MQTTENELTEAQGRPDKETQTAPTMRKTIGGTTCIVTAHFSETSKETMSDKICRMIKRDIENGLDLYGAKKVVLPKPDLYVIFTGERKNHLEYISLKDEFWGGDAVVDAKVKVIYDGQPGTSSISM